MGIGVGLYIAVISISGSAIVFRRELVRHYSRKSIAVAVLGRRMNPEELQQNAQRLYPAYQVFSVSDPKKSNLPAEIILGDSRSRISRLFDPYTGADLGDSRSRAERTLEWLADLHYNLLSGIAGRIANGVGAGFVTLLGVTGIVIWWPGIKNWRRSLTVQWTAKFPRFNWDLHSAIGSWCLLFVLVWGISGIFLCFPGVFDAALSRRMVSLINRLHFGRFGWFTEALWTLLGLAPAALFGTGALMWWNRVLRKVLVNPQ
jgi:uncharacterized iron-regulated membrane protein